jgi:two-component system NtrC family sensor kinase
MNIYSLSSISAAVFCLVLGSFVFIKRIGDKKCRIFGIASIITALWTLFPFVLSRVRDETTALLVARIIYIPAAFTAVIWLHFLLVVIKERLSQRENRILFFSYALSLSILLFAFSRYFIRGTVRFAPHFAVIPGPLYAIFISVFVIIFVLALKEIIYKFKAAGGYQKNILTFIFISYAIGVFSAALHFGAAYLNKEPLPHDLFIIAYTTLFAYAILKYRLMDIRVAVTRTGIFVVVYTLVLGIPFSLSVFGRSWLIATFGQNWGLAPLILLTILATIGPFLYIYLQRRTEALILRKQRAYQDTLKQAARELSRIHNLKRLLNLIVHIVTKTVGITHSAIYLLEEQSQRFLLKATRNRKKDTLPILINKEEPLIEWLKNHKEILVYEEIHRKSYEGANPILKELDNQMKSLDAAIIVPGFLKDKPLGFLILGHKRSGEFYTPQDLDTLSVIANQAALAIENALLYENIEGQVRQRTEELMQVQKQLVQAEKLATVGTLAGGVAHEINNPLTAVLTNVQMLLADTAKLDADAKESLQLIEEATKRCRTIVQKLMTYAKKPLETHQMSRIDFLKVINNVVSFLEYQLEQENIKVIIQKEKNVYSVLGNANELEQVLTNLILNARDAIRKIKKSGYIYINLFEDMDWIKIEVRDEGAGIPKEIMPKIFDPFFTTKEVGKGTGLGLSICQSIVEKHGGKITVQSEVGKGSVFTVQLPKEKSKTTNDIKVTK